jgi:hypothetical protein
LLSIFGVIREPATGQVPEGPWEGNDLRPFYDQPAERKLTVTPFVKDVRTTVRPDTDRTLRTPRT